MGFWDNIRQRYDIAFIGATFAIVFGLAFIFFTMIVSDWMFPGRNSGSDSSVASTLNAVNDTFNATANGTDNGL